MYALYNPDRSRSGVADTPRCLCDNIRSRKYSKRKWSLRPSFQINLTSCGSILFTFLVFSQSLHLVQASDTLHRDKRANIPCGNSFTRCNSRPSSFRRPFDASQQLDDTNPAQFVTAPNIRRQMVDLAVQEAKTEVDRIFNQTEPQLLLQRDLYSGSGAQDLTIQLWHSYMKSYPYAKDLSYSALVSIGASQRLKSFGLRTDEIVFGLPKTELDGTVLKEICPPNPIQDCVPGQFRQYAGYCNNVNHPLWGASFEALHRFLAPDYADDVNLPRKARDSSELPNPRDVSRSLFSTFDKPHDKCTLLLSQWAQFVYDDIVQLGSVKGAKLEPLPCCGGIEHPECYSMNITRGDPAFRVSSTCFPYARTNPVPRENCLLGTREQMNMATAFMDASNVYGGKTERETLLRTFRDGRLKSMDVPLVKDLLSPLPEGSDHVKCLSSNNQPCFLSGSDHVNFLPTTAALHTVWMRQHNRLSDRLKILNPHWDDERLYQEGRKIVGAQIQLITYKEYLPILIGYESMQKFDLELQTDGYYSNYDLNVNPSALNAFASSVGLFYLTLLPSTIGIMSESRIVSSKRPLSDFYFDPQLLYFQDRLDGILRYLLRTSMQDFDTSITAEITEKFLKKPGASFGTDYAALVILMGRDHGLPPYVAWRSHCGYPRPRDWSDLTSVVRDPSVIDTLRRIYRNVEDVDLFVMGLAEKPLTGALMGPTFACVIGYQFQKVRRGDRFWFENFFFPSAFTEEQLGEIRKTSLARIICDNTDNIEEIQPEVFMAEDNYENCPIRCNSTVIPHLNLRPWIDSEPRLRLPITQDTLQKAVRLGTMQAKENLEQEGRRLQNETRNVDRNDPVLAHASVLQARPESLDRARIATILLETTKVLVRGDGFDTEEKLPNSLDLVTLQRLLPRVDVSEIIGNVSENRPGCMDKTFPCDHTSSYRTYNGWCNNLRFPGYGNAFEPFRRLLDPAYNDGFDEPRSLSRSGLPLPSPRLVTNAVHRQLHDLPHAKYTHMLMQFGQFLDHDLTHSPVHQGANEKALNCSRCDSPQTVSINCIPIHIPRNDPHFPANNPDGTARCMSLSRSLLGQLNLGYREQINQLSAFVDASNVYGSTECQVKDLRLFTEGKLNFTDSSGTLRNGLPQSTQEKECRSTPRHMCFAAGDSRVNEHTSLAAMHLVFLREHNRISTRLHRINNFWPDEKIFQETRRIMSAVMQHITYNEFLPKVLGMEVMSKYDLILQKQGYYNGYDPYCDAGISNAFATAAFRFGHTLIRNEFPRFDDFYHNFSQPLRLKEAFLNVTGIYDSAAGGADTLLLGLAGMKSQAFDRHIVSGVRDHLFEKKSQPYSGMDLPAINIQRARDHGLQPYNDYRAWCGLNRARSFSDLRDVMENDAISQLQLVYRSVDDIDLFPGIMSERPVRGGLVGTTAACIIGEQFQRLRKCDRFWYENDLPNVRFTPDQLAEIRKTSLAKSVCTNTQFIRIVQPKIFDISDDLLNNQVPCQDLPEIDLYEWLDRQFCVVDHRVINLGQAKRIKPCVSCTCTSEGPECHSVRVSNCQQLLQDYLFSEILEDTVCVIQCSALIKRRAGQL